MIKHWLHIVTSTNKRPRLIGLNAHIKAGTEIAEAITVVRADWTGQSAFGTMIKFYDFGHGFLSVGFFERDLEEAGSAFGLIVEFDAHGAGADGDRLGIDDGPVVIGERGLPK